VNVGTIPMVPSPASSQLSTGRPVAGRRRRDGTEDP